MDMTSCGVAVLVLNWLAWPRKISLALPTNGFIFTTIAAVNR